MEEKHDTMANTPMEDNTPVDETGGSRLLPILPMSELVLFPRLIIPLALWEESAQRLIDDTLLKDKIIGIITSRQPATEVYTVENLYSMGTAAVILKMGKTQEGAVRLLVQGLYRFKVEEIVDTEPYLQARVTPVAEGYEADLEIDGMVSGLKGLFQKMSELSPYLPAELGAMVQELEDPRVLADVTGGSLNVAKTEKQDLLETVDVKERLRKVLRLINREIEILELGKQVQANVKTEMDKAQKDYYIREQIKALQKELGEGDERSQEMGDLQNRLLEAELPEAAFKEAERELNRLNRIPPTSPDHQVIRNYLEWMIELPWSVRYRRPARSGRGS